MPENPDPCGGEFLQGGDLEKPRELRAETWDPFRSFGVGKSLGSGCPAW